MQLLGIGSALPDRLVGNQEVEALTGIPASRIEKLFSVKERRWSRGIDSPAPAPGQTCSELGVRAVKAALQDANASPEDIDFIVAVSSTPDVLNPPLDHLIARHLGRGSFSGAELSGFTIQAPCSGLFRAADVVEDRIANGKSKLALVVAAETISPFFALGKDVPRDMRFEAALYADAAGAMVFGPDGSGGGQVHSIVTRLGVRDDTPGIMLRGRMSTLPPSLDTDPYAYGGYHDFSRVLTEGSKLTRLAADAVLEKANLSLDDIRLFITHQATGNMEALLEKVGLPVERTPLNIAHTGNTISASIPTLMAELHTAGELKQPGTVCLHTAESSTWSVAGMAVTY